MRGREEGDIPDEELKVRFELLDVDKTGKIEMHEYLIWSLKDCLARASTRLVVIFQKWDEDGNGAIDEAEFYRAVRALGMPVDREDTDAVFKLLDADGSGTIQYKELNEKLRQGIGSELAKRNLSRAPPKPDRSRTAKLNAKNVNMNYTTAHVAALPETVKLDASSSVSLQEQLRQIVKTNSVKLVDLFADWDEDGNGGLDKKEFRKGIAALGYDAPNKDIDASEYCLALRAHTLIRSSCGGGRMPVHMRIACIRSCSVHYLCTSQTRPPAGRTRLARAFSGG